MTPEEKEELRERLDKAGIPRLPKVSPSRKKSAVCWVYSISPEKYDELIIKQNGKCAICDERKKLDVDHDHLSGQIRGLLCRNCNALVGMIEKNNEILIKVQKYIGLK